MTTTGLRPITAPALTLREEFRVGVRDRILDVAADATLELGWQHVRLAEVSRQSDVSRATLYREFGTKDALAHALMAREAGRALVRVREDLQQAPTWESGLRAALQTALHAREDQPLLAAVLDGGHGDTALLPLLTTRSGAQLVEGRGLLTRFLRAHHPRLTDSTLEDAADVLVRATVSHLVTPEPQHQNAVERVLRLARRLLPGTPPGTRAHTRAGSVIPRTSTR